MKIPVLFIAAAVHLTAAAFVSAQPVASPVRLLDVPYIQQSEALCGGAAAAMVMRYWGETRVYAESFSALIDSAAGGIRSQDLLDDLKKRGWDARSFRGDAALVQARLAARQPVIALIEDRPGAFHFVVVVAWVNGRVVYHDPARAPFRVVAESAFEAVWQKSDRWTLLALPGERGVVRAAESPDLVPPSSSTSPCDGLVAEGVRAAESGERARALEVLGSAAAVCPHAAAPLRESAGVHALAGNWTEAARDARAAVARDPADQHAWRILATAAYVNGDHAEALNAWNAIGEPRVDLVTIHGLERTRHAAATSLMALPANTQLTPTLLAAAGRRLAALPSADMARVRYVPQSGGRANVEGVVLERSRWPTSKGSLVSMAAHAAAEREVAAMAANLTGGGEAVKMSWRWWEQRPRIRVEFATPSALGVWRAELMAEKQTYGPPTADIVERRRGGLVSLSNWTSRLLRWELGVGVDAWERGRTATLSAAVDQRLAAEHVAVRLHASALAGAFSAQTAGASAEWRSRLRNEGLVFSGTGGLDLVTSDVPLALWPGAGTGHARGALLRAHPLLDDGRIRGEVFGRRVYHATTEVRRWTRPLLRVVRVAPAVFVDAARAERRSDPVDAWHVDAGVGLRLSVAGSNILRLDVGKGLRDGATAFSIGWVAR